jgi:hypothetical protein
MTVLAYRFALNPTPAQERALRSSAGAARVAFNWGLARGEGEPRPAGSGAVLRHRRGRPDAVCLMVAVRGACAGVLAPARLTDYFCYLSHLVSRS